MRGNAIGTIAPEPSIPCLNNSMPNTINTFTVKIALLGINEKCDEEQVNSCLEFIDKSDPSYFNAWKTRCEEVCDVANSYSSASKKFYEDVVDTNDWGNDADSADRRRKFRVALAYRVGGKKLATRVCENPGVEKKDDCYEQIQTIEALSRGDFCGNKLKIISNIICHI